MIVNKIIMDSELRHNKTGSILSSIDSNAAEVKLEEYQKNMKIFVQSVQKQMASIIDKYENKIKELKRQIERLKSQLQKKGTLSTGFGAGIQSQMTECFSPIKTKGGYISGMQTVRSNFFQQLPMKNLISSDHNFFQPDVKSSPFDYKFDLVKSPQTLNKSRFQMQSKKQKQRQQDLLHFLEMGKSNLELNTGKMFELVGRSKKQEEHKDEQNEQVNVESPTKKRKGSEAHNTSLNSICDSLNNSFHGKKAQQKSLKKRKQIQRKQGQQARKEQQRQKFKKQQGIKNLLTTMRKNISSSLDKPVEIIKGSKLLTTGQKGKSVQASTKAKVMINPVPVDLQQINKQKHHNSVTTSPSKHVQSILKNSSTNFLTKSIENISAISFYSSGEE